MPDGKLKIYLHRYPDKPASVALKRTIGNSAVGITMEEAVELRIALAFAEDQALIQPNSSGVHSSLDLGEMVRVHRSRPEESTPAAPEKGAA